MKVTLEQQNQANELLQSLIAKAWESTSFKEQLISNPVKTIGTVTGNDLTALDQKIVVEDQTDSSVIYLNIPRKAYIDNFELTDEQLEAVSGGDIVTIAAVATVFIAAATLGYMTR